MNPINAHLALTAADEADADAVEQAFDDVLHYQQGGTRKALTVLENHINQTFGNAPARKRIVDRLLELLEAPGASPCCKNFVCKKLMLLGGPESVPALARLRRTASALSSMKLNKTRFSSSKSPPPRYPKANPRELTASRRSGLAISGRKVL